MRNLSVRQRHFLNLLAAALAAFTLSACASSEYMGISLKPGAAAPDLQELAQRAHAGDKQAQLDLGIRFEEGRGVSVDLERAKKLYQMAANDRGGILWVYSPSPGGNAPARVIPVDTGPSQAGLAQAKLRLEALGD